MKAGIEKILTFGNLVANNINNKKIILYSRFIDVSGMGPVYLNIEFVQAGQSIKMVSIVSKSNESYWQILYGNFDNNDQISYNNSYYENNNDPGINYRINVINNSISLEIPSYYEHVTYNSLLLNVFDLNKKVSVFELNETLETDLYITLPNIDFMGTEKLIIMGESINKYINNYKIIISTIVIDGNGNGPNTMNIEFNFTGQHIKLLSFVNKRQSSYGYKNKYWQILYGSYDLYSLNDIVTEDLIIYKQLISINPNLITYISLDKNLSVLELNSNIQSNIYLLLPLVNINGFIKTIILGETINTYKNNKNIIIYGNFMIILVIQ